MYWENSEYEMGIYIAIINEVRVRSILYNIWNIDRGLTMWRILCDMPE